MKKSLFTLFAVTLLFGFTSICYSENVVSLKHNPDAVSPQISVDIHLSGGKGVAGYNAFVIFDPTVLKYVTATMGDYLPSGGIFVRPLLSEDGTYTLALDVAGETKSGTTVTLPVGPEGGDVLPLSQFFFEIPSEEIPSEELVNLVPPTHLRPGAQYSGVSVIGSSPLSVEGIPIATDGDGTLVTLTFEVLDPEKPAFIFIPEGRLLDENDAPLPVTHGNLLWENEAATTDVNGDGVVNILDLTRVASVFGQPVTDANRSADVNSDGEINILDLVQVANDFGKSTTTPVETSIENEAVDPGAPQPENAQQ